MQIETGKTKKEMVNLTESQYSHFIHGINRRYAKKQILAGDQIYDELVKLESEAKTGFSYIKTDLLGSNVIVRSDKHPLAYIALPIDRFLAFERVVQSIQDSSEIQAYEDTGGGQMLFRGKGEKREWLGTIKL